VVLGAVVITAVGIDATDTLGGKGGTMLGQLVATDSGVCPVGMVEVPGALSFTCVDTYEAVAGDECPSAQPKGPMDTEVNLKNNNCAAVSEVEKEPWRFITREQAAIACARAGKRLPNADEWYTAALGTVDSGACNIDSSQVNDTGNNQACRSAAGAEDMIGNVWEWVSDDVINGEYNSRSLPPEGYVAQVDNTGVPIVTDKKAADQFNQDYFWTKQEGIYGILRGGYYDSETDAGLYAVHAKTLPTSLGTAIGFRCVK